MGKSWWLRRIAIGTSLHIWGTRGHHKSLTKQKRQKQLESWTCWLHLVNWTNFERCDGRRMILWFLLSCGWFPVTQKSSQCEVVALAKCHWKGHQTQRSQAERPAQGLESQRDKRRFPGDRLRRSENTQRWAGTWYFRSTCRKLLQDSDASRIQEKDVRAFLGSPVTGGQFLIGSDDDQELAPVEIIDIDTSTKVLTKIPKSTRHTIDARTTGTRCRSSGELNKLVTERRGSQRLGSTTQHRAGTSLFTRADSHI